ncbi:hypothetical protein ACOME3_008532 [Neoechinorhynchus agilis]
MDKKRLVSKVTFLYLPSEKFCTHLDTILVQIKRDMWVVQTEAFYEASVIDCTKVIDDCQWRDWNRIRRIIQYQLDMPLKAFNSLREFVEDITVNDFKIDRPPTVVLCDQGEIEDLWREQWSDSSNILTLKEGVIVIYESHTSLINLMVKHGMKVMKSSDFVGDVVNHSLDPDRLENTVITIPSRELVNVRGGTHCLVLPLCRDSLR